MRFSVYHVEIGRVRKLVGLGYVNAPHGPAAINAACKRWPKLADWKRASAGFAVRPYKSDVMSLGKKSKDSRP